MQYAKLSKQRIHIWRICVIYWSINNWFKLLKHVSSYYDDIPSEFFYEIHTTERLEMTATNQN
jgi:hypothetical protein